MFELDKYTLKARLYPSFLVLLPAFILCLYYITDIEKYYHYFTAAITFGLFTFLLSQLGRDKGKSKEPFLFQFFGGKPTIQILRHRNDFIDNVTKLRYHNQLTLKIDDIHIPTFDEEKNNPDKADEIYDSCSRFLISKTRDTKKFNLLFKENVNFGFRRNLWGMKYWALLIIFFCIICHFYFATNQLTTFNLFTIKDFSVFTFLFISSLFWIFVITKNWVKIPAFAYAERLYETLNVLE